jgi:hypothetical protein
VGTSISVSAVNTGTDELTATAHGLLNGARFRLRNIGGALPAATPALAGLTDYFAIVTGVNTLKVATSSSNAFANIAVDITGAGTGTHLVQYGLPYCVPRIAAPLTQVFSEDDNAAWQSIVALNDRVNAPRRKPLIGVTYVIDAAAPFNGGLSNPTAAAYPFATAFRLPSATGHTFAALIIPTEEGETLCKVDARVACGAGVTVTMSVKKSDASGNTESITGLGSLATSAGSAGNLETLTSGVFSELVGSGFVYYYVQFSLTAGASATILGAWATVI